MSQFGEPWKAGPSSNGCSAKYDWSITDANGKSIIVSNDCRIMVTEDQASRIAACVSACAGIPTEVLENEGLQTTLRLLLEAGTDPASAFMVGINYTLNRYLEKCQFKVGDEDIDQPAVIEYPQETSDMVHFPIPGLKSGNFVKFSPHPPEKQQ
jgi:hypothetical protein